MDPQKPRGQTRIDIALPCTVEGPGFTGHGKTCEISVGGMSVQPVFQIDAATTKLLRLVKIEGVGTLAVNARWTATQRIGFMFTNPRAARDTLRASAHFADVPMDFWKTGAGLL